MVVSVALPDRDVEQGGRRFALVARPPGILTHDTELSAGISLGVDLMAPDRWASLSSSVDDTTTPLLPSLVGCRAARQLRGLAAVTAPDAPRTLAVDLGAAGPWIRVAVVNALDFWLQLPLDQALIDAERGVALGRAAQTVPDHAVRRMIVGEALQLARQASSGFTRHLRSLGARRRALPAGLATALRRLVEGYAELRAEVEDSSDHELAAVLDAWQALTRRLPTHGEHVEEAEVALGVAGPRPSRVASMIDPRQVRARIFALSTDPSAGEVTMADTQVGGGPAVRVQVRGYRRALDQPVVQRLLVRIMDAQSADLRGQSVLTAARARGSTVYFEGTVPLRGSRTGRLRADVFDLLSEIPPAATDTDRELRAVRRATVLLSEWRRLLAVARLPVTGAAPAARLQELAGRLAADGEAEEPLFAGGPSAADLDRLAAAGDAEILRRARFVDDEPESGMFGMVRGAGGLLAAELAAVRTAPAT